MKNTISPPKIRAECLEIAREEAEKNWYNYDRHGRSEQDVKCDVFLGKYGEAIFWFENSKDILDPPSFGKNEHDGGVVDLVLKRIGPVQLKVVDTKYVNDKCGYKRNAYPSIDNALLVQGFYDKRTKKIEFYCQAPSKLNWRDSKKSIGRYLDRRDMVKWTNDEDMFKVFGKFPKPKIWPDDDISED